MFIVVLVVAFNVKAEHTRTRGCESPPIRPIETSDLIDVGIDGKHHRHEPVR